MQFFTYPLKTMFGQVIRVVKHVQIKELNILELGQGFYFLFFKSKIIVLVRPKGRLLLNGFNMLM